MEDNNYKYKIRDLVNAFKQAGYPVSASWIYRREKDGSLVLPRSTTNLKSIGHGKKGGVRIMTHSQLWEVVKEFLPGGSGKWNFKR